VATLRDRYVRVIDTQEAIDEVERWNKAEMVS
jgi:hypothetical protein